MPQDLRVSIVVRTLMGYLSMDTPAISLLVQPQFPYWMEIKLFTSVIFLRLRNLDLIDLTDFISLCCDIRLRFSFITRLNRKQFSVNFSLINCTKNMESNSRKFSLCWHDDSSNMKTVWILISSSFMILIHHG